MENDKKRSNDSNLAMGILKGDNQHLLSIIDFLPDATMVINDKGEVVAWNKAMELLTGVKAKHMLGKGNHEYALPFYGKRRPILLDLIQTWDETHAKEYIVIRKVGETLVSESYHPSLGEGGKYLSSTASRLYNASGEEMGAIESIRDITTQKQTEEALIQAKKKAEEATLAKSAFLANMSHEIRTPMNAVIGLTHLTLQTKLTSKQIDYLQKMQASAESLLGIINDILDFSKIEAGKLDVESITFNLDAVLSHISNVMGIKAEEKGIELIFNIDRAVPIYLIGDPLRLGQVLLNLVNNAVNFTKTGEVVVSVELMKETSRGVLLKFSVSDTGIGLTEEQKNKLFQPFTQADHSITHHYDGTGLGLTICKRLVKLMGGNIGLESKPGQGSTFFFDIECNRQSKDRRKYRLPNIALKGSRVLLVEDNQTSRDAIQNFLHAFSFEVTPLASAEEAIRTLEYYQKRKDPPYRLALLQWNISGVDGIKLARRMKQELGFHDIPIIIIAPCARMDIKKQVTEAGLDGTLFKPVFISSLFEMVMEVLGEIPKRDLGLKEEGLDPKMLGKIQGARILLVEDNAINQFVVREILENAGLVVTTAYDGKEAVEDFQAATYDAVLMDIQMPVMDGYTATREIRKIIDRTQLPKADSQEKEKRLGIPIIAMTAHAMVGERMKSLDAGMDDYVAKPINPDELLAILVKWISPRKTSLYPHGSTAASSRKNPSSIGDKMVDLPVTIPGISVQDGLKRVGGNRWLYKKLLTMFLLNHRNSVKEITSALESGDKEKAIIMTHTLKGLAGTICAHELQRVTTDLEATLRSETNDLDLRLENVSSMLKHVISGIASLEKDSG